MSERDVLLRRLDEWQEADNAGPLIRWAAAYIRGEGKADGWHVYHVCGGVLRNLRIVDGSEALCVYCGEWSQLTVTPESQPLAVYR